MCYRPDGMRLPELKLTALLCAAFVVGCASQFDGRTYRGHGFAFQVPQSPEGWRPMDVSSGALAFEDSAHNQILVNARCDRDGEDVPLSSLTNHLFLRFTERKVHAEEVIAFDGREALRTDISAKLDGVEKRFLVWVLKKDGCVYDLLYFATPETFEQTGPTFDAWARGFRALPREVKP